jgi:hypothetical protein
MYLADAPDGAAVGPETARQMAEMPGGRGD